MSEIKQEVLDLAAKLKAGISVAKDGSVTVEPDLFKNNLPEGVDAAVLEAAQKHTSTFIAAAAHVLGEQSIAIMKKNAEVQQTSVSIPTIGKDTIDLSFQRQRSVPAPDGNGTNVKYGSLSAKVNIYGAGSRGQLLKVKQELSDKATAAFGG